MQQGYSSLLNPKQQLYCPQNHQARLFCSSPTCKQKVIICYDSQCQYCTQKHQVCKSYKIKALIREVLKKRQQINPEIEKSIKSLQKLFDEAIQKLSDDKMYFIDQMQLIGFNNKQLQFLGKLQSGDVQNMSGKQINQLIQGLSSYQKWILTQQKIQKFWNGKKNAFQAIFNTLRKQWSIKKQKMKSLICTDHQQFLYLENLWGKRQIEQFRLLFRASDHGFSTEAFHKICDGKKSLLVLAKTQNAKNIGGFNEHSWDLAQEDKYLKDKSSKSFLFSLTNRQKFFVQSKNQAICNKGVYYGPTFGNKDFWIGHRGSAKQNQSYFDIGNSYAINHKYKQKQQAIKAFTGNEQGKVTGVRLVQWEVFELIGPTKQESA